MKFNNSNALYGIFNTLIKCCGILLIMGFIFTLINWYIGYPIYMKESIVQGYNGWTAVVTLNSLYGMIGILIPLVMNILSFIIYNYFVSKMKVCMTSVASIIFLGYSFVLNALVIFCYAFFNICSFSNPILELFRNIFLSFGFITYPIIFLIIYLLINKRKQAKKHLIDTF